MAPAKISLLDRVIGRWDGILMELAPVLAPAIERKGKHVPCPVHHGSKDGFRLFPDGSGGGICATCGAFPTGFDLLHWIMGEDYPEVYRRVIRIVGEHPLEPHKAHRFNTADPRKALRRMMSSARPVTTYDPVHKYLCRRGITRGTRSLRYHPACWESETKRHYPAMLSIISDPVGVPVSVHRTFLSPTGEKAPIPCPKKIMPSIGTISGGAIRLHPETNTLAITEGIETALSVHILARVPTWAAISAQGMAGIQLPESVRHVEIWADNDGNYAGQRAAYQLAYRLSLEGRSVEVKIPEQPGDWNDVLRRRRQ